MSGSQDISVRVMDDGRRAEIHIPAGLDVATLTPSLLHIVAADAHVRITAEVERRLAAIAADYKAIPKDLVADIAHAIEPIHGTNGTWVWEPRFDPSIAQAATIADSKRTDHHASHLLSVVSGAPIARVHTPGDGTDGWTVTGSVLPARPGSAASIRPGEGLEVRADGVVVAKVDGVLEVSRGVAVISSVLEVKGSVDFSTGNIDFKGSVYVAGAVRGGFKIRATGSITVNGAIEGADLVCGGDLTCPCGIASAHQANVVVNGNSNVGYLRNVAAIFRGDLACQGELEHSSITVGGECRCDSGRVIGGRLELTSTARVGTIGSPDWVPTVVCVSDFPLVAMDLRRLGTDLVRVQKIIAAKEEALHHLLSFAVGKSASARERLTELQYELSELRREAMATEVERAQLHETMRQSGGSELQVTRVVYPRTKIQHGDAAFEFEKELKGPVTFLVNENGAIHVKVSSQNPRPIIAFARAAQATPVPVANPVRQCA